MKARSQTHGEAQRSKEFKGVVKKMTGKLTNDPELEREGTAEMGGEGDKGRRHASNPDPHRRG